MMKAMTIGLLLSCATASCYAQEIIKPVAGTPQPVVERTEEAEVSPTQVKPNQAQSGQILPTQTQAKVQTQPVQVQPAPQPRVQVVRPQGQLIKPPVGTPHAHVQRPNVEYKEVTPKERKRLAKIKRKLNKRHAHARVEVQPKPTYRVVERRRDGDVDEEVVVIRRPRVAYVAPEVHEETIDDPIIVRQYREPVVIRRYHEPVVVRRYVYEQPVVQVRPGVAFSFNLG